MKKLKSIWKKNYGLEGSMNFQEYLKIYDAQSKINKLAKRYKNKKVAVYGAGQFAYEIFNNYDLSKLNIIAVADLRFEDETKRQFFGYNCIPPEELGQLDCDLILIANFDYNYFLTVLDDHILYLTPNQNIEIRPLIRLSFKDLFLKKESVVC